MTITASIIEDSISEAGHRLTTMQLRYPRFVHAEFMTHRVFSRNASSSRAIPVERMIQDLLRDPAMPVYWGSNKPGMQAGEELSAHDLAEVKDEWTYAMTRAINSARVMIDRGLHKQIANRILEPWAHINVVVTATEWDNFYQLRCHPDAQPEMRALAEAMRDAQQDSTPNLLQPGEWHLPYVHEEEFGIVPVGVLRKLSVARCARVSYLTHDGKQPDIEADITLYERLVGSVPIHASPAEHQGTPDDGEYSHEWANFIGWRQFRKQLERR